MSSITERIEAMERELGDLKVAAADEAAQAAAAPAMDPEVKAAAVALAKAVAKAQGIDMPLQVADGDFGNLPILTLPPEFAKFGGIGVGVMVAPPTDAARR